MKFFKYWFYKYRFVLLIILITIGIVLNGYAGIKFLNRKPPNPPPIPPKSVDNNTNNNPPVSTNLPPITPTPNISSDEPKYGHFPYAEANQEELMIVASYATGEEYQRFEQLVPEAALAMMKMIYAARDEGVWIVPVSGFRTIESQEKLFKRQVERKGSPKLAAKVSAPAGYSEHHTGYTIDLSDGNFAKQNKYDISDEFAESGAFKWLEVNAQEFGFELSFPENNAQGVSYEPWHWRFVGSPNVMKIFADAKNAELIP